MAKKQSKYNKGWDDDVRAAKLDELKRHTSDSHPTQQFVMQGLAEVDVRCLACNEVNRVPKETAGAEQMAYCRRCRTTILQTRIYA